MRTYVRSAILLSFVSHTLVAQAPAAPTFRIEETTIADIHAAAVDVRRHHLAYRAPIVIDARMKPGYPDELIVRPDIAELVDRRWREYFPQGLEARADKSGDG